MDAFQSVEKEDFMRKTLLKMVAGFSLSMCLVGAFTACGGGDDGDDSSTAEHAHQFTLEVANESTLATEANCAHKATYYYTCDCGEKGTETFESGEVDPTNHTGTTNLVDNENGTHDVVYGCCQTVKDDNVSCTSVTPVANCTTQEVCACGHVMKAANANHTLAIKQGTYAGDTHTMECTVAGCDYEEEANHDAPDNDCMSDDTCTCGHVTLGGTHTYDEPTGTLTNGDVKCSVCGTKVAQTLADVMNYSKNANDAASLPASIQSVSPTAIYVGETNIWTGEGVNFADVALQEGAIVRVVTAEMTYYYTANLYTNIITTVDEFFAIDDTTEALAGHYLLGQDIDFEDIGIINPDNTFSADEYWAIGVTDKSPSKDYKSFTGVIDGNGYALKNVHMYGESYSATNNSAFNASLIMGTKGATIKNLMADLYVNVNRTGCKSNGLVGFAEDTKFENCVVVLHTNVFASSTETDSIGTLAGMVKGTSTITNCVGVLDVSKGAPYDNDKGYFGVLVGYIEDASANVHANTTMTNSYGIYVGADGDTHEPTANKSGEAASAEGTSVYKGFAAFYEAVSELSSDDGWNGCWKIESGKLYFGDEWIHLHELEGENDCTAAKTCECGYSVAGCASHLFDENCTTADECTREGCEVKDKGYDAHDYENSRCTRCGQLDPDAQTTSTTYSNFTGNDTRESDGYFDRGTDSGALSSAKKKDSNFDGVAIYQSKDEGKAFQTTLTLSEALKEDISSAVKLEIRYYMWGSNNSTLDITDEDGKVIFQHDHPTSDAWYTFTIEDASVIDTIAEEGVIRFGNKATDTYFAIGTITVTELSGSTAA